MEKWMKHSTFFVGLLSAHCLSLLGGYDVLVQSLLLMITANLISGLCKAFLLKTIDSQKLFVSLFKILLIFFVIAISVQLEKLLGDTLFLREFMLSFYIAYEGLSFLENTSLFIPYPDVIQQLFIRLQKKEEKKHVSYPSEK